MKAYLIDPEAQTVSAVDYSGKWDSRDSTEAPGAYELVRCVTIETQGLGNGDAILFDEEFRFIKGRHLWSFTGPSAPIISGRGLIVGRDDEGNDAPPAVPLDFIRAHVVFLSPRDAAARYERQRAAHKEAIAAMRAEGAEVIDADCGPMIVGTDEQGDYIEPI